MNLNYRFAPWMLNHYCTHPKLAPLPNFLARSTTGRRYRDAKPTPYRCFNPLEWLTVSPWVSNLTVFASAHCIANAEICIHSFNQTIACLLAQKERTAWPAYYKRLLLSTMLSPIRSPNRDRLCAERGNVWDQAEENIDTAILTTEALDCPDIDKYYESVTQGNMIIQSKVSDNIERAQHRMEAYYEHGTRISEIAPQDFVLVKDECRPDTLTHMFRDPCPVIERRNAKLSTNDPHTGTRVYINKSMQESCTPHSIQPSLHGYRDPATETSVHDTTLDGKEEETDKTPNGSI